MPIVMIETDRLRMTVLPELGGAVGGLWRRTDDGPWTPVLRPTPEHPSSFLETSMYLLAPWSNRVSDGRFRFGGREHRLPIDWPQEGCAIHGLVKDRPWQIIERTPVSAWLATDTRWWDDAVEGPAFVDHFGARIGYELTHDTMTARLQVTNTGSAAIPCGIGFHPHFVAAPGTVIRCDLDGRYPADRCLPTAPSAADGVTERLGRGADTSTLELDDCFLGSADGATLTGSDGRTVRLACSDTLSHIVIYAPGDGRRFVCIEPVTMANNGFNLDGDAWRSGVRTLGPGESLGAAMSIIME